MKPWYKGAVKRKIISDSGELVEWLQFDGGYGAYSTAVAADPVAMAERTKWRESIIKKFQELDKLRNERVKVWDHNGMSYMWHTPNGTLTDNYDISRAKAAEDAYSELMHQHGDLIAGR